MRILFLLSVAIISGCATEVSRLQEVSQTLRPDSSFYVLQCVDGQHDGHRQISSGLITSQRVAAELKAHTLRVDESAREENLQNGLKVARNRNLNYLVNPSILEWENEATPMASVPNKIKIRIDIIDVVSENIVDTIVLQNQTSEMATSKTPPQELLAAPLKDYVEALIRSEPQDQSDTQESEQGFWEKLQSWFL